MNERTYVRMMMFIFAQYRSKIYANNRHASTNDDGNVLVEGEEEAKRYDTLLELCTYYVTSDSTEEQQSMCACV